jgi:hypothetical protein
VVSFIICTIHKLPTWIDDGQFFISLGIDSWKAQKLEYAWLWKFFAEPLNAGKLTDFWVEVQKATVSMLGKYKSGNEACEYFQKQHVSHVQDTLKRLHQCFTKHQINDNSQPLIFIFDEARTLCDHDAYTGYGIYEEHTVNFHEPKEHPKYIQNKTTLHSFSNFRALQCALRLSFGGYRQGS